MTGVIQLTVTEDEADIRLDRWFSRHYANLTHGSLSKLLRKGQIRVDGKRAETSTRLAPGQVVRVPPLGDLGDKPPPPPTLQLEPHEEKDLLGLILYRDARVIVLNKPAGMPVQGGPGITRSLDALLDVYRFGADDRPRLVHRLDRDTSGVLLIATGPASAAKLAASFRTRQTTKTYWAIVAGLPVPNEGRIDAALAKRAGVHGERVAMAESSDEDALFAITDYRVEDHAGRKASWVALQPVTGRTHQLRVHCAAIGTPILGDGKYGGAASMLEGLAEQLHLHARAISIPHPDGGTLSVEAPLPPHMAASFAALGFQAPKVKKPTRGTTSLAPAFAQKPVSVAAQGGAGPATAPRPVRAGAAKHDAAKRDGVKRDGSPRGAAPRGTKRDGTAPDRPRAQAPRRDGVPGGVATRGAFGRAAPARDGSSRDGASRDGASRDGASRDGAPRDAAKRDGPRRDGSSRDGAPRDATKRDGPRHDGAKRAGIKLDAARPSGPRSRPASPGKPQPSGEGGRPSRGKPARRPPR